MSGSIQAVRGMRDVMPEEARRWRSVESALERVLLSFAYEEVQLPLLEFHMVTFIPSVFWEFQSR